MLLPVFCFPVRSSVVLLQTTSCSSSTQQCVFCWWRRKKGRRKKKKEEWWWKNNNWCKFFYERQISNCTAVLILCNYIICTWWSLFLLIINRNVVRAGSEWCSSVCMSACLHVCETRTKSCRCLLSVYQEIYPLSIFGMFNGWCSINK